jgi:hypothetical protein
MYKSSIQVRLSESNVFIIIKYNQTITADRGAVTLLLQQNSSIKILINPKA